MPHAYSGLPHSGSQDAQTSSARNWMRQEWFWRISNRQKRPYSSRSIPCTGIQAAYPNLQQTSSCSAQKQVVLSFLCDMSTVPSRSLRYQSQTFCMCHCQQQRYRKHLYIQAASHRHSGGCQGVIQTRHRDCPSYLQHRIRSQSCQARSSK